MTRVVGSKIKITGIVQGVGFRPFVYGLAKRLGINGWVRNTSAGVVIEIDAEPQTINRFVESIKNDSPPLSRIDSLRTEICSPHGFITFEILDSEPIPGAFLPISPDVSICDDCLRELFDPKDPRYRYPFINCTNCGPRFTIIKDIPYDRPLTTMSEFNLCEFCLREYQDPLDRRFHAQPVACPVCGPQIWLEILHEPQEKYLGENAMETAIKMLSSGKILAIKGLGGFHLACDATNPEAVIELRRRKLRVDKPFALMFPDITTIAQNCYLDGGEIKLLHSKERPIVLVERRPFSTIAASVAPNQKTLGVMLPYTPLHYLLFRNPEQRKIHSISDRQELFPTALVMTSGNISEEPIAYKNQDAIQQLGLLADAFLMHDREIHIRTDDSVVRYPSHLSGPSPADRSQTPNIYFIRRSRGYAPNSISLPFTAAPVLAVGPELKNTFCLVKDNYAFLSHHIGDMENYETLKSFTEGITHFENLFRINPKAIACDLHPDYLSTRYALERSLTSQIPFFQIQHHHAHIASCMVDNGLNGDLPVIGVSFDGTGLGTDGAIWGGEFLIADYKGFQRVAHLEYSPLPGGDAATKNPYRIALAQLWRHHIDWDPSLFPFQASCGDDLTMLRSMLENRINTPLTSSVGRLFDSVSALIGVRSEINYEAQAAIELENIVDSEEENSYPFDLLFATDRNAPSTELPAPLILSTKSLFETILQDIQEGIKTPIIAARFHNGLAKAATEICHLLREMYGINEVALSGGVWQNMVLLKQTYRLLTEDKFIVYTHRQVPTNDGGLALGQAVIASCKL